MNAASHNEKTSCDPKVEGHACFACYSYTPAKANGHLTSPSELMYALPHHACFAAQKQKNEVLLCYLQLNV